jgi:hypothetical protein
MIEMIILLLCAHALCDYPLQGDFLAKAKNNKSPIIGVPWWQAMSAHCGIHAGAVMLVTGFWALAVAEFVIHFLTDWAKGMGLISYNVDQGVHAGCKILWAVIAVAWAA